MSKLLRECKALTGKPVQFDCGESTGLLGQLLEVCKEYAAIYAGIGFVCYVNLGFVKSVALDESGFAAATRSRGAVAVQHPIGWMPIKVPSFCELLRKLRYKFVFINPLASDRVEGVIAEVTKDTVKLVHEYGVSKIPVRKIKTVCMRLPVNGDGVKSAGDQGVAGSRREQVAKTGHQGVEARPKGSKSVKPA